MASAVANSASLLFARGDGAGADAMLADAVGLALLLGAALAAFMLLAGPACLAALAGPASADVVAPALAYVRIRAAAAPAAVVSFVVQSFFLAARNTSTPLAAAVLAGAVNLVLDIVLVCGAGAGIAGAAWATVAAQAAATGFLLARLARPPGGAAPPGYVARLAWRLPSVAAARAVLLGYAAPIVALLGTKVALYAFLSALAASLGPAAAAAHHLAISVFLLHACFGDAVSAGAQAWLPASVGDPQAAAAVAGQLLKAGLTAGALNVALVTTVLAVAPPLFTSDPAIAAALASVAPLVALTLGVHTASMATEGMLLAGRDLGYQAGANFLNVGLCVAAARAAGPSLTSVWAVLLLFQATRLIVNAGRLWGSPASPLRATEALPVAG
jgi:Na+-driven multidrug efflux pump